MDMTTCNYPECLEPAAPAIPGIQLCQAHTLEYLGWKRCVLRETLVPETIALFVFLAKGGATVNMAAARIGYNEKSVARMVRSGRLRGEANPHHKRQTIIPRSELATMAVLKYAWVSTAKIADTIAVSREIFRNYAVAGKFGPTLVDLYGNQVVRAELLTDLTTLRRVYKQIAKKAKVAAGQKSKSTRLGEFSTADVAAMMEDMTQKGVLYWCLRGYLKHRKNGKNIVVAVADLLAFIDEYEHVKSLRAYTRQQLRLLRHKLTVAE